MNLRFENLHAAAGGNKLSLARSGESLGEFTAEEVVLCLQRQDGGITLADHVLDKRTNTWRRLADLLSEPPSIKSYAIGMLVIIIATLIIFRFFAGSWGRVWDMIQALTH